MYEIGDQHASINSHISAQGLRQGEILTAANFSVFVAEFKRSIATLDKRGFDVAVRLAVRCLLLHARKNHKEVASALAKLLKFKSEDTSLANPTEFETYATIVGFFSADRGTTVYKVRNFSS